jgi:hypothetical protein
MIAFGGGQQSRLKIFRITLKVAGYRLFLGLPSFLLSNDHFHQFFVNLISSRKE